ncbi:iron-containing alcohol dehydrogenase [Paraburkholderia nodosa]|uniref:iron-containing alcohol dehydrogenase n=1 Tax=Paraburkholderia nodosa TaxID=392320 RepID=UPI000AEBDCE1|nr:iron-containing alcohol dehydrogenase [Paraburkholderia nodosa]
MSSAYAGPGKYIQRAGEISRLSQHVAPLGRNVLVLIDPFLFERFSSSLQRDLEGAKLSVHLEKLGGECTLAEIARVAAIARGKESQILVGVGGGKTADTIKIAVFEANARTVIVPTIASTDAV